MQIDVNVLTQYESVSDT